MTTTEHPPIPMHEFVRLVAAAESRNCSDPIGTAMMLATKIAALYALAAADHADPLVITSVPKPCEVNLMGERDVWRYCLSVEAKNHGADGRLFTSLCSAGHVVFERWVGKNGVWAEQWPADAEDRMKAKADEECKDSACVAARAEKRERARLNQLAFLRFQREMYKRYSAWVASWPDGVTPDNVPSDGEVAALFRDPLLDTEGREAILAAQAKWPMLCRAIENARVKGNQPAATALAPDEDLPEFEPDDPEADSQDIPA